MQNIINLIKEKYLIGEQQVELLENGNILFIDEEGKQEEQTQIDFINDYIDFLEDLYEFNRQEKEYQYCINILQDMKMLYDAL